MNRRNNGEIEILSTEIRIENKRFYFNLKENQKGRFLKIAEVSGGRSTIIIPESGWADFRDMLEQFITRQHHDPQPDLRLTAHR